MKRVAVAPIAVVLVLLASCTNGGDDSSEGAAPGSTTMAETSTSIDPAAAQAALAYQKAVRERVADVVGFATNVESIHRDLKAGTTDVATVRTRGAGFVTSSSRVVDDIVALGRPEGVTVPADYATVSVRLYREGAEVLAALPDARSTEAAALAVRVKLLADRIFDRSRVLVDITINGQPSETAQRLIVPSPVPEFDRAGVDPGYSGVRAPEKAVSVGVWRGRAREVVPVMDSLVGPVEPSAEGRLRGAADSLAGTLGGLAVDEAAGAARLALLVGAEAAAAAGLGLADASSGLAELATSLWNAAAPVAGIPVVKTS